MNPGVCVYVCDVYMDNNVTVRYIMKLCLCTVVMFVYVDNYVTRYVMFAQVIMFCYIMLLCVHMFC